MNRFHWLRLTQPEPYSLKASVRTACCCNSPYCWMSVLRESQSCLCSGHTISSTSLLYVSIGRMPSGILGALECLTRSTPFLATCVRCLQGDSVECFSQLMDQTIHARGIIILLTIRLSKVVCQTDETNAQGSDEQGCCDAAADTG